MTNTKAFELPNDIGVTAESVIVVNLDNDEIVYTRNPDEPVVLASLTKIMTAYTVINNVDNLSKKVTITEEDLYNLYGFTCAGLKVGDKVTYLDLLYAMMLPSGADASQALALATSKNLEDFYQLMNQEAQKIGLHNSHFADAFGRDDNNVSTARDLYILLKEALANETFKKIFSTDYYTLSNGLQVVNYTDSLATFHGLDHTVLTGSKPGYTEVAELLLASTAYINDTNYLIIVCKSKTNEYFSTHVLDTFRIIDLLENEKFTEKVLIQKGEVLKNIPVVNATIDHYLVISDEEIKALVPEQKLDNISYDYHVADKLTSLNKIGDNLGFVDVKIDDEVIATYHVYLKDEIFSYQKESKKIILIIVILAVIAILLMIINFFVKPRRTKVKLKQQPVHYNIII